MPAMEEVRASMISSPSSRIVSAGELLWDLLPSGPRLGGTTTNFAILCARLGDFVALVSCVGRDEFGALAIARLEAVATAEPTKGRFELSSVRYSEHLPTGTVTVTLDDQRRPHYVIDEPVAWDDISLSDGLLDVARHASAICYGTLAQRGPTSRDTIRALVEATTADCIRVCDVNLRMPFCSAETLHWCLAHATILKISDEELPDVARLLELDSIGALPSAAMDETTRKAWATHAAQVLLSTAPSCAMIAITMGPHGSLLATRERVSRHPGYPTQVVDTIGAGDAFTAGMVHAFVRGASLEQINIVSNLCGSYVASQPGATPEIPLSLLDQIKSALDHTTV